MKAGHRHSVFLAVGALMIVMGAAGCGPRDPIEELRGATANVRVFEARRSDSGAHVVCAGTRPAAVGTSPASSLCGDSLPRAELVGRLDLVRAIEEQLAAADSTSPAALRALAGLDLLATQGVGEGSRRALDRLRLAASLVPDDPDALNDLAAALLVLGRTSGDPWSTAEALDLLERIPATENHAAARFNRALALERLGLVNEARAAWTVVVDTDPSRGWRDEARVRLAALDDRLERHPPRIDTEDVVAAMAAAPATPSPSKGPFPPVHLMPAVDAWAARGDATARLIADAAGTLEVAIQAYGRADSLWAEGEYTEAGRWYGQARRRAEAPEPGTHRLRWLASLGEARSRLYRGDAEGALRTFRALADTAASVDAFEIRAHARYGEGLTLSRSDRHAAARVALAEAGQLFEALDQAWNAAAARALDAEILGYGGASTQALRELTSAFGSFGRDGGNMHQNVLSYAGRVVGARFPLAARRYHVEAFHLAEANPNRQFVVEARIRLAQAEARAGDTVRARALLEEARDSMPSVKDVAMRARVQAEYDELVGMHVPGLAVHARDSLLTAAIGYFEEANTFGKLPGLLQRRGRHRLEQGMIDGGRRDLRRAVAAAEDQLGRASDPARRTPLLEARSEALDALLASHLALGDTIAALVDFDRPRAAASSRSRGVWDALVEAGLGRDLTRGQAVLSYAVSDGAVHTWVIRTDGVAHRRLIVDVDDLAADVDRLRFLLRTGASTTSVADLSGRLYTQLFGPLESLLSGADALVVVPDGPLHSLPFAILGSRPGQLLERFELSHAPSVAFALVGRDAARGRDATVLAAFADAWDSGTHPELPPLPFAPEEARSVAALYTGGQPLRARAADLAARLSEARVLHFAGHGIHRPDRPDLSELVTSDGSLSAADIARLDLAAMELAVLAACDTQQASSHRAGGVSGLTWSFLEAGAGGVIGSLWAVPDASTSAFMVGLHRRLADGQTGPSALRAAQLAHLEAGVEGWGWAAFRYEGVAR